MFHYLRADPESRKGIGTHVCVVTLSCSLRLMSTESVFLFVLPRPRGNVCKPLSPFSGTGSQINITPFSVTMQQLYPKLGHPGDMPTEVKGLLEILRICDISVVPAIMISENGQAPRLHLLVSVPGRPHHYLVHTPHG